MPPNEPQIHSDWSGLFFVGLTAVLWGVLPFFLSKSFEYTDAETIISFRFLFSFIVLFLGFVLFRRESLPGVFQPSIFAIFAALMLAGNYYGFTKGLEYTSPTNAQVLIQAAPLLFTLFGVWFFKEKLSRLQLVGLAIATLGFSVFYQSQIEKLLGDLAAYHTGNLFVALAAITWALYAVFNKIALRTQSAQQINVSIYGIAALCFIPLTQWNDLAALDNTGWLIFISLGFNTVLAYGCLGEAIRRISAAKVSIVITLNPLITLFISDLAARKQLDWIAHERVGFLSFSGAMLVICGAVLVVSKRKRKAALNGHVKVPQAGI